MQPAAFTRSLIEESGGNWAKVSTSYATADRARRHTLEAISEEQHEQWTPPPMCTLHWDSNSQTVAASPGPPEPGAPERINYGPALFEDPRVLPCSHSFCKTCLEGLLEGARIPTPSRCPTCRQETPHHQETPYSLQTRRNEALRVVSRDAQKATEYPEKVVGALETKKLKILCDVESLKLAVMDAYDPKINLAASCRDLPWSGSGPLGFLQQMQEFREKLRVVQDSSPLTSRTESDLIVSPHLRDSDLRRWDSLRLRDLDRISVCGSLSSSSWLRVPKMFFLSMSLLLPALFLLHPETLCAFLTHLLTQLPTHLLTHLLTHHLTHLLQLLGGAQQVCLEVLVALSGFLEAAWGHLDPHEPGSPPGLLTHRG
ncbi:hypothetical protein CRUP_009410 [Coryphaenoides rupestris]|nr:hypothetical protein CRUP_009410 [Coryphaenoides rupestris]